MVSNFVICSRELFDWENEELAEKLPEAEKLVYPDVLAKIPGPVLKSDLTEDNDAILTLSQPTFEKQAATG